MNFQGYRIALPYNIKKYYEMDEIESKKVKVKINPLGEIQVSILQVGNEKHLMWLEDFLKNNEQRFQIILMQKPELKNQLFFQRAIQAFINHIQASGIEQASNQIMTHFKNWIFSQNGNLLNIINGKTTTETTDKATRADLAAAFEKRYSGRG